METGDGDGDGDDEQPNLVFRMMMVMSNPKNMMWMVMGKHIVVLVQLNCVKRKFANIEEKTLMRVTKID